MQFVAIASAVMSAVNQMRQGSMQAAAYQAQAKQVELQGRGQAVKYAQQAVLVARRTAEAQAIARARAAAGGIDPFGGSAGFVQVLSGQEGARDLSILEDNAALARTGARTQADMLRQAARTSRNQGLLGAFSSGLQSAATYSNLGGPVGSSLVPELRPGQFSMVNRQYG